MIPLRDGVTIDPPPPKKTYGSCVRIIFDPRPSKSMGFLWKNKVRSLLRSFPNLECYSTSAKPRVTSSLAGLAPLSASFRVWRAGRTGVGKGRQLKGNNLIKSFTHWVPDGILHWKRQLLVDAALSLSHELQARDSLIGTFA